MPKKRGDRKQETVSIRLPEELIREIERIIDEHPELGYVSVPEFVREAVRDYILYLRSLERESAESSTEQPQ
ncbi:ribbon-helix-helix domain-containing protein [Archaeoglobus veneficus]|uniref:CopG-like domain-containing protein DNA-binding protein n=1 Tax=Archaeoglobus veneficus (strain DSM 11195 / SNP6) TaxID=693661 RepID=F2KSA4_ARCVS|nr:ribbon-helix-helix domain-containing protein [Archaeoglobus veneficus]AEA48043.1 CopG-like domain-containing protein DNA-binding protein [Archaeoglobus veneficus SNP6]